MWIVQVIRELPFQGRGSWLSCRDHGATRRFLAWIPTKMQQWSDKHRIDFLQTSLCFSMNVTLKYNRRTLRLEVESPATTIFSTQKSSWSAVKRRPSSWTAAPFSLGCCKCRQQITCRCAFVRNMLVRSNSPGFPHHCHQFLSLSLAAEGCILE